MFNLCKCVPQEAAFGELKVHQQDEESDASTADTADGCAAVDAAPDARHNAAAWGGRGRATESDCVASGRESDVVDSCTGRGSAQGVVGDTPGAPISDPCADDACPPGASNSLRCQIGSASALPMLPAEPADGNGLSMMGENLSDCFGDMSGDQTSTALAASAETTENSAKHAEQVLHMVSEAFSQDEEPPEPTAEKKPECEGTSQAEMEVRALAEVRETLCEEDSRTLPDAFLRKCLVHRQWRSVEAAVVAQGFLSFRRSVNWPLRISASEVEVALRTGMHWLLPSRAASAGATMAPVWHDGDSGPAACLVYNAARLNPKVCPVADYQKMANFLIERATDDLATQARGIAMIIDLGGVGLGSLLQLLGLDDVRRGVAMWKGTFPCRLRRIWVVDAPTGARPLAGSVLSPLAPKASDRIRFAWRRSGLVDLVGELGAFFVFPASLGGEGQMEWDTEVERYLAEGA